jgi:hypothetical protein
MRCALYARVSTLDQQPENQLAELRRYVEVRGWGAAVEYVDHGVSGSTDRRPALDRLVQDARRRKFDVLVTWKLDRLGRHLKHLITLLEDLQALGVAFVSLGEGIDATTPAGKLQMHILGAMLIMRSASRSGAGQGAGETSGPAALRDYPRPVRGGRGPLAEGRGPGAGRQPIGRCIDGGCHVNPSNPAPVSPRMLQQFSRPRREAGCHAGICDRDSQRQTGFIRLSAGFTSAIGS